MLTWCRGRAAASRRRSLSHRCPPLHPGPRAVIMACVVCVPFLLWFYRRTLTGPIEQYDKVLEEVRTYRITDWALFSKCGAWAWERCKGQGWGWSCVTLLGAAWSGGCTGVAVSALQERSPARFPTSAAVCLPCPACAAYVTGVVLIGFLLHPVHHVDPGAPRLHAPAACCLLPALAACCVPMKPAVDRATSAAA